MTIIKKSFVFAGMLLDIIYLIKWLKKYRWFKNKIELLKKIELLNVSDAKSIFKGVPNGEKKYLAIKGKHLLYYQEFSKPNLKTKRFFHY